jgi:hypothetical protein
MLSMLSLLSMLLSLSLSLEKASVLLAFTLVKRKLMLEDLLFSHKHYLVILPIVLFLRRK